MITTNQIARIGLLIGEPARTAMMLSLMNGQALTAGELARVAGISAPTASAHLAKLSAEGLLKLERQGRHRYFRLSSPEVARLLENMMQLATGLSSPARKFVTGPRDGAMRRARTCYDHFAGRLGVNIADALQADGFIEFGDESGSVSAGGIAHLARFGMELDSIGSKATRSRPLCRPCLDWSERRPHVAGAVGAAICRHFLRESWVRRIGGSRALEITPAGNNALYEIFGLRSTE